MTQRKAPVYNSDDSAVAAVLEKETVFHISEADTSFR
jgi:hypothetical protein